MYYFKLDVLEVLLHCISWLDLNYVNEMCVLIIDLFLHVTLVPENMYRSTCCEIPVDNDKGPW